MTKKSVAVIGSGVSGLAACWSLSQTPELFQITLFEKNNRFGGHCNTIDYEPPLPKTTFPLPKREKVEVDTGFIVFNYQTYPNFVQFLKHENVEHEKSDMSFSVSRDNGKFEWSGKDLNALLCQPENLLNFQFYQFLLDVLRFNATAVQFLKEKKEMTIGEYLSQKGYSQAFIKNYLLPMTAAIWSTPADQCWESFPAETLIRFMNNHGLLSVMQHPQWYTITKGSRQYVEKILDRIPEKYLNREIISIERTRDGVLLRDCNNETLLFDDVIFATHADEALKILSDPLPIESEILSPIEFTENRAVVHSDPKLMPLRTEAWSAWNSLCKEKSNDVSLTYWMNLLQNLDSEKYGQIFVTLNPLEEPKKWLTFTEIQYKHPLYNLQLIKSQEKLKQWLPQAVNETRTLFCGAWTNFGFHEDGFTSGLRAAELLGAKCPFSIEEASYLK